MYIYLYRHVHSTSNGRYETSKAHNVSMLYSYIVIYIIEFIVFAFIGWILDSIYSSFEHKRKMSSGYFEGLPLCPIYGVGGIVVINNFALLVEQPWWVVIAITTTLVITIEYVGGRLAEYILEERLWDYRDERYNLHGYISAWHSFLWLLIVTILYIFIGNTSGRFIEWVQQAIRIETHLDVMLVLACVSVFFWLTIKNKKHRLSRKKMT